MEYYLGSAQEVRCCSNSWPISVGCWAGRIYMFTISLHCVHCTPQPIALARQSLYVKFDPLVRGISPKQSAHVNIPPAIMAGRSPRWGKGQDVKLLWDWKFSVLSLSCSNDLLMLDTPPHVDSSSTSTRSHDLLTISAVVQKRIQWSLRKSVLNRKQSYLIPIKKIMPMSHMNTLSNIKMMPGEG